MSIYYEIGQNSRSGIKHQSINNYVSIQFEIFPYSLLGAIFPLPRILYSMANDGLIFNFLAKINARTKTPLISTVICGVFAGKIISFLSGCQLLLIFTLYYFKLIF